MDFWFRALFLFSSFGPLYLIVGIKLRLDHPELPLWWGVAFGAAVLTCPAFLLIRSRLSSDNPTPAKLSDVKAKDTEVFGYLTTYIAPLLSRDLADPKTYWPLLVLYALIGLIFMRLDSPYLNPYFSLWGYRLYEARLPSRALITIIARRRRLAGTEEVVLHEIGTGDLYACERPDRGQGA